MDNSGQIGRSAHAMWFSRVRLTSLLVVSLLLVVMSLLYRNCEQRVNDFITSQQTLMEKSAADTVQALAIYIKQTRRTVELLATAKKDLIFHLSQNPEDELAQDKLDQQLQQYIPDYFSFTITDSRGEPLLDDFDGEIGDVCRQDIELFAQSNHPAKLMIHPNALQYHFDIMSQIKFDDGSDGIFFVSFKPDVLSQLLANSEIGSHQMLLLHKEKKGLIELSSKGSRVDMGREFKLNEAEINSITVRHNIPDSLWELVYIPDQNLYRRIERHYQVQALEVFAVVFVFSVLMIVLIRREEMRRVNVELALQESHNQLESRVQRRTEALSQANETLQTEIRQRKRAEKQLQHDALHDVLTGLPNRNLFMNHLEKSVKSKLRDKDYLYAVMFIDLDDFKMINDSMGHEAGDILLKTVATRLLSCLRPGDTLARFGGDEFVALITNFNDVNDLSGLAERMNETVAQEVFIHEQGVVIHASTGIALGSDKYVENAKILRDADSAMYQAKKSGSGKYFIFEA